MAKERSAVSLRASGPDYDKQSMRIEIGGLNEEELERMAGLFLAKGKLQKVLANRNNDEKKIATAVRFLCQNCSFGSLEVSVQRAAMVLDDG